LNTLLVYQGIFYYIELGKLLTSLKLHPGNFIEQHVGGVLADALNLNNKQKIGGIELGIK
jgi:hypothetical protein